MTRILYADILRPGLKWQARLYDLSCVIVFSALIALSAQIAIRLPFSPVPLTGQTLAVLLTGMLLGSKRGAATIFLYIAEGAAGLPVFASGAAGFAYLAGPTGGYIFGFVASAWLAGIFAEREWDRNYWLACIALLTSSLAIFFFGVLWLSMFVGFTTALKVGFLPFIPGDIIKTAITAALLPMGWKLLKRQKHDKNRLTLE